MGFWNRAKEPGQLAAKRHYMKPKRGLKRPWHRYGRAWWK